MGRLFSNAIHFATIRICPRGPSRADVPWGSTDEWREIGGVGLFTTPLTAIFWTSIPTSGESPAPERLVRSDIVSSADSHLVSPSSSTQVSVEAKSTIPKPGVFGLTELMDSLTWGEIEVGSLLSPTVR